MKFMVKAYVNMLFGCENFNRIVFFYNEIIMLF